MKVAWVTGAGEGIGLAVAEQFIAAGLSVAVNDVDPTKAEAVAASLRERGGQALAVPGDVADVDRLRTMVSDIVAAYGRLDIAVANAGITSWGGFLDYPVEAFDRLVSVNLRGTYFTAQAAARQMRDQGTGGRIVLMSSVTGHQAIRYLSAYGMSKAALEMLAKNLVVELSPYQITINTVAPGATITPRNLSDDPNYAQVWGGVTPIGQANEAADVAAAVAFLCSDAARTITGQTLVVDGGWTAISPTPGLDFVENKPAIG